jgi:hypothetical protein
MMIDLPPNVLTNPDLTQQAAIVAYAQPQPTPAPTPTPPPLDEATKSKAPWRVSFTLSGSHAFSTDFDKTPGSVAVSRAGAELGILIPTGEKSRLAVNLDWTTSFYDFKDATGFAPGFSEPWSDIHAVDLSAIYSQPLGGKWGMVLGATIGSAGEEGAEFSDTLTYGGFGAVSHQCTETFSASLGLFVQSRIEDNVLIIPIPGIDWKISDEWRLATLNRPGLSLLYTPSKAWTFSLGATFEGKEFRLNDRDAAPEGVGRDRAVPIELGFEYAPSRNITLGGYAGVYAYRKFRLEDTNGNKISEFESEATPVVGLNIKFAF